MEKGLKDQRVVVMMTKREIELIDDWMFARRIRSRGEAIRQLCNAGILLHYEETEETKRGKQSHRGKQPQG